MKVSTCPTCDAPVVAGYDEEEAVNRWLDLKDVDGGPYELVGKGIMRRRMTTRGEPRRGGRGLRLHVCPAKHDPPPLEVAGTPEAVRRVEQRIVQRKPKVDPTDGYVDCTGATLGKTQCAVCASPIIVAMHHLRPDGERPVLLDAGGPIGQRPWRVFAKVDDPDTPRAMYLGDDEPGAKYRNHRTACPKARPT